MADIPPTSRQDAPLPSQARTLTGRTAAITGGARGIGRATASALLAHGMRVAIGDLDLPAAQATAEALGPSVVALPLDVTDRGSFEAFLAGAEQRLGPLDVLINNAGIMQLRRLVDEDDATTRRMVEINVNGVILGTKLALERMIPRNSGHIVNIASQAGKTGLPGGATYSATKHAVVGLTEAVRGEMRLMGVDVRLTYVLPAIVDTELGAGLLPTRAVRKVSPEEVAAAIVRALRHGTVDVWVPPLTRPLTKAAAVLPRRVVDRVAHLVRADRTLFAADADVRRGYELRAARSQPALPAPEPPPQP